MNKMKKSLEAESSEKIYKYYTAKMRKMTVVCTIICLLVVITAVTYVNIKLNPKESTPTIQKNDLLAMYLEDESGDYTLSSENKFPTDGYVLNLEKSFCKNGGALSQDPITKAIALSTSSKDECTVYFDKEHLFDAIKASQAIVTNQKPEGGNGVRTSFDEPAVTDEGVFEMEDDYGTSYYYRGDVSNNYVQFAGFYWRIIRVNGDGSLRILFDGAQAYANGANNSARFIGTSPFNKDFDDNKYVGYMYGPAGTTASTSRTQAQTNTVDSTIKTYIDNWYKTNIVDKGYSNVVADMIFCNDRSTPGKTVTGYSEDTGLGYGANATAFGATARMGVWNSSTTPSAPTFKCPQRNDAFTVSDTVKGNGALTYPVGLITADEIITAGSGKYGTDNKSYYLYRPSNFWWSLSPNLGNSAYMFAIHTFGTFNGYSVYGFGGVAPVINLSAEYVATMRGTGTMSDPYTT